MTTFWILAAGLLGLAILFVVFPLLRPARADRAPDQNALNLQVFRQRLAELDGDLSAGFLDQGAYTTARQDLERELLCDLGDQAAPADQRPPGGERSPWLALALALVIPVGAVLVYQQLGDSGVIARLEAAGAAGASGVGPDGQGMPSLEVLVQGLAEKLEKHPENLDGWLMLARTYYAIEQPAKALGAMERAYQLAPDQARVLVAYAEALAANGGNQLKGRPAELIAAALQADPANPSARWLSGMLAYQEERFADAASTWQALLDEMDPAGQEAEEMRQMVAEANAKSGPTEASATVDRPSAPAAGELAPSSIPSPAAAAAADAPRAPDSKAQAGIRVNVSLDPRLSPQAIPEQTVFVYARAVAGPPMPLAAQRIRVADLPASLTLDDSMAMMPAMRLSAFPQVIVGARVSRSGQAMPASGDLEGHTGPVDTTAPAAVSITIDRIRP